MSHTDIRYRSTLSQFIWSLQVSLRPVFFVLFVLGAFASPAIAQDLTHKAAPQAKPVAIIGATIHPVSGPVIDGGYVVFDKGVITQIGPGKLEATAGMTVVDARGKHVYPGLIGAVTSLGLVEIGSVRQMRDLDEAGSITPEAGTAVSINPDSTLLPVARAGGVLTVGVFPTGGVISGQPSAMRLDGWTWEEMTIAPCLGVQVGWPQARPVTAWWMNQSKEEQLKEIRKNVDAIDQTFKTARAYAQLRAADPNAPVDVRWESMRSIFVPDIASEQNGVVAQSQKGGQGRVFIQAGDVDQITQAVAWAVESGLRPVIIGGRDAPLCAEILRKHEVPVIATGVDVVPRRDDSEYDEAYSLPARMEAAGLKWCLASGEEPAHERRLAENAGRAAAYGLDPEAALRAITLSPAEILGIGRTHGSLDQGKSATLIVTDGDVLEIATHVERAFIDGREIDLTTKQSKLAEKYRERYRQQKK